MSTILISIDDDRSVIHRCSAYSIHLYDVFKMYVSKLYSY